MNAIPASHDDKILTAEETAAYLRTTERTLQDWRLDGTGPQFIRIGHRSIRYRKSAVDAWLRDRTFASTTVEKAS
ncbi:MAG: helix-turn-helix transcriptional regulator [Alphaproteobacteria bacterium]